MIDKDQIIYHGHAQGQKLVGLFRVKIAVKFCLWRIAAFKLYAISTQQDILSIYYRRLVHTIHCSFYESKPLSVHDAGR